MTDRVHEAFLRRQAEEGLALTAESDLIDLLPLGDPANRFLAIFTCKGLVEARSGGIVEADRFEVGISFAPDYLRAANPFRVLSWLGPRSVWHPNISSTSPSICVGHLAPGTGLVDICYQVFEIITWNRVTMREDDALNRAACQWARNNAARFPVDRRPLKRRALDLKFDDLNERTGPDGAVL